MNLLLFLTILMWVQVHCTYDHMSVFLLACQSNMVGQGGIYKINANTSVWDGIVPPESQPNPNILRLNNDLQWEIAQEPLHLNISPNSATPGVGPGLPFANSVLQPQETIGLVPCAVSGSSIGQWQRGTPNYDRALSRARAAVSYSRGGGIRAVLWYQGEADTFNEPAASAYKGRLLQFFNDLREDLQSPYLPIFQVALAKGGTGTFTDTVREAQLNTGLPNVFCVDVRKLNVTLQNDTTYLHLDTPSQVKLGKALATAFLNHI